MGQIEAVLLDEIAPVHQEGLKKRSGATVERPDAVDGRFHSTLRAGFLFAITIGFCLDRTPGMAFAKTLDLDKNTDRQNDSI